MAATVQTSYEGGSDNLYGWGTNSAAQYRSQGFQLSNKCSISRVDTYVTKAGSPTCDTYAEIRNDDGSGKPGSTVLATSSTVNASSISTGWVQYNFSAFTLEKNTQYHVCYVAGTTDGSNNFALSGIADGSNPYTLGDHCHRSTSGDAWSLHANWEMKFKVWGEVVAEGGAKMVQFI